jgi:hypothetical protein
MPACLTASTHATVTERIVRIVANVMSVTPSHKRFYAKEQTYEFAIV